MLSLVALLRRHGKLSAGDLARRLEVDRRTILRDVEALSAAGFGIYTERGRSGGIMLLPEYRPDVGGLTADESRALFLAGGQPALTRLGLAEPLSSALNKLGAGLPAEQHQQVSRTQERIVIDADGWSGSGEPLPELDRIQQAVFTDRRLRFDYQPMPPRQAGTRTVDPYGLLQTAGTWYLIAAHRGRPRTYRVSRISAVRILAQPSIRPDDLDLRRLWQQLRAGYASRRPGTPITVRTTAQWADLVSRNLSAQATGPAEMTTEPEAVVITVPVTAVRGAVGVLAGFGDLVEVLGPPELITGLLEVADQLRSRYRS